MPLNKQPQSLLTLAYENLTDQLIKTCRLLQQKTISECSGDHIVATAKNNFRPFWIVLPGQIRCQLLERCSNVIFSQISSEASNLGIGPGPLFLLTLLLAPDVRYLRVDLCCYYGCTHQNMLLNLLSQEGTGLESVELARTALLRLDGKLLQMALQNMTRLRKLTLRNIANDGVLSVIGATCHNLQYLDVEHSRQVSDAGLKSLLFCIKDNEPPEKETTSKPKGFFSRMCSIFNPLRVNNREKTPRILDYAKLLDRDEAPRPISYSLRILKIANTGVTYIGIILILKSAHNIESIGEYCHLGRALEMGEKVGRVDENSRFNLKYARTSRTPQHRIDLISQACPFVQKLCITEPLCNPNTFSSFEHLTSLQVNSIRTDLEWAESFYTYLSRYGSKLHYLTLRFFPSDIMLAHFDLAQIVAHCPNLKSFIQDGAYVDWVMGTNRRLDALEKIQLGKEVSKTALLNIIRRAPNLRIIHVYNIEVLHNIDFSPLFSSKIECFYVYESGREESVRSLVPLILKCPRLTQLGWIQNWTDLEPGELRPIHDLISNSNLNFSLTVGGHWYCSNCFPMV